MKEECESLVLVVVDMICCLGEVEEARWKRKNRVHWVWTSPTIGCIKVNVDDSFLTCSRRG